MQILKTVDIDGLGEKHQGKVRDYYILPTTRILITTDRISAFDSILGYIPYKGQVLNQLSAFWFTETVDIVRNHMLSVPDPNVMVVSNAQMIPIEVVVRGYITGVTGTSIWGSYANGERNIYGIDFPEGLRKNQKLPRPVITPTTKPETGHDERLTRQQIIEGKLVDAKLYRQIEEVSLELYEYGRRLCEERGLILVDTKYEFGLLDGELILIDEIHTPDSSRFWIKKTYEERFEKGMEPENFDKEFLRLWYKDNGYTGDGVPPTMPTTLQKQVSKRYIDVYEMITGLQFAMPSTVPLERRIRRNMKAFLKKNVQDAAFINT
jgi:phosphoribosylaminoimidazole-succinocarboxamide synthase